MALLIVLLVLVSFLLFIFYFGMPVLNYGFWGAPLILLLILGFLLLFFSEKEVMRKWKRCFFPLVIAVIALTTYVTIVPIFTTWQLFHAKQYRNLIGEVKSGESFTSSIEPISLDQIRVVDQKLARIVGEKTLGTQPALGSQVVVGEFNIQMVNGNLYWVAPLLHSGFFKWNKNSDGTPGYVMVSATNERDVKLVQTIDGNPVRIKYQPNAFFGQYLSRHIYFNGYITKGLTDFSFEIDDNGKPYWVVSAYKKEVGFGGIDVTGVVVVDAQNGDMNYYTPDQAPAWIDRIQPEPIVQEQLDYWGKLVHGYWNFSNRDELETSAWELTLIYGENGKSYWYAGLSSVGVDESTVGFALVDTRTKETIWFKQPGATEQAARTSAEGKVQEKNYIGSFPIPYNINGIPTYVITLKDWAGLVKMYAMVAIEDYTIVGVGNSLSEAQLNFKSTYNMAGNKLNKDKFDSRNTVRTVVLRFATDIKNGNSFYYITTPLSNQIFVGTTQISQQLPLTSPNDSIVISFDIDNAEVIDLSSFTNISLGTR